MIIFNCVHRIHRQSWPIDIYLPGYLHLLRLCWLLVHIKCWQLQVSCCLQHCYIVLRRHWLLNCVTVYLLLLVNWWSYGMLIFRYLSWEHSFYLFQCSVLLGDGDVLCWTHTISILSDELLWFEEELLVQLWICKGIEWLNADKAWIVRILC